MTTSKSVAATKGKGEKKLPVKRAPKKGSAAASATRSGPTLVIVESPTKAKTIGK